MRALVLEAYLLLRSSCYGLFRM